MGSLLWKDDRAFCPACGIEVQSGMMGAMCPHRERCEFWPEEEDNQDFLDELGMRAPATEWPRLWTAEERESAKRAASEGAPMLDGAEAARQDKQ